MRRQWLVTGILITSVLVGATVTYLLIIREPQPRPLPNPNGYDDFLRAGHMLTRQPDDVDDLDQDGLRTLVATNTEALRVFRLGLTRHCAVPLDLATIRSGPSSSDLIALKSLAKMLSAEGRLAEIENRPADAARSYLEAVTLGVEMSRGGLMMNRLVGIACEAIGSIRLVKALPKLNCEQLKPLVTQLQSIDDGTSPWRDVAVNENRFARAQLGKYPNPLKLVSDLWKARSARSVAEERHNLAAAHLRLLATELALRCYRCDQGRSPVHLDELVPKYLERKPSDPFSHGMLVYQAQGTNWLLYSLGPDKVDNGGKPLTRITSAYYLTELGLGGSGRYQPDKGDLFYDSPW